MSISREKDNIYLTFKEQSMAEWGGDEKGILLTPTLTINSKEINFFVDLVHLFFGYFYNKNDILNIKYDNETYSDFYPFSCSCGIAGCNGIFDGINSKTRKHSVEWRIPKESGYNFLDKSFYSFHRKQYEQMVEFGIKQLKEYSERTDFNFSISQFYNNTTVKEYLAFLSHYFNEYLD